MNQFIWKIAEKDFYVLYNTRNGVSVFIPNKFESREEEVLNNNHFFREPNYSKDMPVVRICLNPTSDCNFRCRYCFNSKKKKKSLSFFDCQLFIDKVVAFFPNAKVFYIDMAGSGEPLLKINLVLQIADYCRFLSDKIEKDVIPMLATNGSLLSPSIVSALQKHKVLFGISLDGYQAYHDSNRIDVSGEGTYKRVLDNFNKIKYKSFVGGAMTFGDERVDVYQAYQNMLSLFQTVSIRPERKSYQGFDFSFIEKGYEELTNQLIDEALLDKLINIEKIINGDDYFGGYLKKVLLDACLANRCDIGITRLALGTDKKIYGCSSCVDMDSMKMYDSIEEMKMKTETLPFYNQKTKDCKKCVIENACGGECPIMTNQGYHSKELCLFRKLLFELSEKLCGTIFLKNPRAYKQLFLFAHQVLLRNYGDPEIKELLHCLPFKMSFTQLKDLRDEKNDEYQKLKTHYM